MGSSTGRSDEGKLRRDPGPGEPGAHRSSASPLDRLGSGQDLGAALSEGCQRAVSGRTLSQERGLGVHRA